MAEPVTFAVVRQHMGILLPQHDTFIQRGAMSDPEELLKIAGSLENAASKIDRDGIARLEKAASEVGKAFSGSWLGYHSRIYYRHFQPVPPGARFSVEWGLMEMMMNNGTVGDWCECDRDGTIAHIEERAGNPKTGKWKSAAKRAEAAFEEAQAKALSILSRHRLDHPDDKFLTDLASKIEGDKVYRYSHFVKFFHGGGQSMTRDMTAMTQGVITPAHIHVLALAGEWKFPFGVCENLANQIRRASAHLAGFEKRKSRARTPGTHVFIGHGRSTTWKEFRDFVRDRVGLPWDEFNRVPVAGIPTTTRLLQMVDDAAIAFLVLTAEDEQADGKFHPRMNVIHEAGLFQGRLGLERAIILLEEGCEEFSNVHGLGQIRFPRGNISQAFEEVRRVLEREGLIPAPETD